VRLLSRVPLGVLYRVADLLAFLANRVVRYRRAVVLGNLRIAFPELDERALARVATDYYAGYADVLVEIIRSAAIPAADLGRRVSITGLEVLEAELARGRPALLVAAHQCNWEWMLLALSLKLGAPLDAAYKPLVDPWAEREMKLVRTRFGARLVPAQQLLGDLLQRRKVVRAIAMVADQEPVQSEQKHWTTFLNRESAFFLGAEEIVRKMHYAAFFIEMRRTARGRYEMGFRPIVGADERLAPGEFTERYVKLVEAQIRAAPADWPWSHKRWRLRRSVYEA
jgi:KDO2-lipid IV(A) lauroyltransferase